MGYEIRSADQTDRTVEKRFTVFLSVYEDASGAQRFALDHFNRAGQGHVLSWVCGRPPASVELDLFAQGVADSSEEQ